MDAFCWQSHNSRAEPDPGHPRPRYRHMAVPRHRLGPAAHSSHRRASRTLGPTAHNLHMCSKSPTQRHRRIPRFQAASDTHHGNPPARCRHKATGVVTTHTVSQRRQPSPGTPDTNLEHCGLVMVTYNHLAISERDTGVGTLTRATQQSQDSFGHTAVDAHPQRPIRASARRAGGDPCSQAQKPSDG